MTITDEMVEMAYSAMDRDPFHSMKAALSAVAPLIRSAALEEAARVADAEAAARNLNRTAALRGSQEWGVDPEAAAMAQGHKALTARDLAAAIRSLKDKQPDTRTPTEGDSL